MISNQIASYDEKFNIQTNVFEDINSVCEKLTIINAYSNKFGLGLPMPSYTNFRDALFHYTQIYELSDVLSIYGNIYSLREHLQRSIKDAWVTVLNKISNWLEFFCTLNNEFNKEIEDKIKNNFPDFTNVSKWNLSFFKNVRDYLRDNTNLDLIEINYFCLVYCARLVQCENTECVTKIRTYLHSIKNFSHKMRSAGISLIKTYTDDNDFQNIIKELDDLYSYLYSTNINHSIYFAISIM